MSELNKLSLKDQFQCFAYAYNTLFLGARFCQHLIAAGVPKKEADEFAKGISDDLQTFAEEHARNMLRRGLLEEEKR